MSDLALHTGSLALPASTTWWSGIWGAVGVTNGLTTVSGTLFTTNLVVGQRVSFANQGGTVYVIASITSATALVLTTAFTGATNAATAMGFSANPVFCCDGESRLRGYVYSSVVPTTNQFQLSQDGTNWDTIVSLVADPGSTGVYSFDINLVGVPFFRLVTTAAASATTVRIEFYTIDDGSGVSILGGSTPPPNPAALPATFRLGFDAIVFGSVGGNFLELRNPAASGRVLRVTLMMLCKPSVPIRWRIRKQSTLDDISVSGAATTPTPVPLDSGNAATVGIVRLYTTTPGTLGTAVGVIWSQTVTGGDIVEDDPGVNTTLTQPVVLRAGESVAFNSDVAFTFQGAIEFTDATG